MNLAALRTAYETAAAKLAAKVGEMQSAEARGDWDSAERVRKAVTRLDCAATKAYRAWDDAARSTRTAWTH
jgi:hypothetical protein